MGFCLVSIPRYLSNFELDVMMIPEIGRKYHSLEKEYKILQELHGLINSLFLRKCLLIKSFKQLSSSYAITSKSNFFSKARKNNTFEELSFIKPFLKHTMSFSLKLRSSSASENLLHVQNSEVRERALFCIENVCPLKCQKL